MRDSAASWQRDNGSTRRRDNGTTGQQSSAATKWEDNRAARRRRRGKDATGRQDDGARVYTIPDIQPAGRRHGAGGIRRQTEQGGGRDTATDGTQRGRDTARERHGGGRDTATGGTRRRTGHGANGIRRERDTAREEHSAGETRRRAGHGERQSITHKKPYLNVQTIWSRTGGTRGTSRSAPLMCGDRTPPISERNYASRANLL